MTTTTTTQPTARWAIHCAYAGGAMLTVVPFLVEFVHDDLFLLLPIALVLTLASMRKLKGSTAYRVFTWLFIAALTFEVVEQFYPVEDGAMPIWLDAPPPILFTLSGIALLVAARMAGPVRR